MNIWRELSPISLSIAMPNASLKGTSAKFDLSKILQGNTRYNAHSRVELVVSGGFSGTLKIWSSERPRGGFEGLASNYED